MNIERSYPRSVTGRPKHFIELIWFRLIPTKKRLPFTPAAATDYFSFSLSDEIGLILDQLAVHAEYMS